MKLTLCYGVEILAPNHVLANIAALLMQSTDEEEKDIEFKLEKAETPDVVRMKKDAQKYADEKLEAENKNWLQQYRRAERLQNELNELRNGERAEVPA